MENSKRWMLILSLCLLIFNMVCIYLIICLHGHDEILNYLTDGTVGRGSPKGYAWPLFINAMCNSLYVWAVFVGIAMRLDP